MDVREPQVPSANMNRKTCHYSFPRFDRVLHHVPQKDRSPFNSTPCSHMEEFHCPVPFALQNRNYSRDLEIGSAA